MDQISIQRIQTLHPLLRDEALLILKDCDKVLTGNAKVRFTHTNRSFLEQSKLYNLGRTVANPDGKSLKRPLGYKVTNAQAGDSIHNYAMAIDICLIINGKEASWNTTKDFDLDGLADWIEVVSIFKKYGWSWGGDWSTFVDKPHFEKTFGYKLSELKKLYNAKDFIKGTQYLNIEKKEQSVSIKKTTSDLNLRSGSSTSYKVIQVLKSGTEVVILKNLGDWSEVFVCSLKLKGFVSNSYLK